MTCQEDLLERFVHQRAVLLTTYRREGTPVGTAVHMAVDGDPPFVRTPHRTAKMKRLRHNPNVEIASSIFLGKPTGPAIRAEARLLSGDEADHASRELARKYRILQGVLAPLAHRLTRSKTMHYELTPIES